MCSGVENHSVLLGACVTPIGLHILHKYRRTCIWIIAYSHPHVQLNNAGLVIVLASVSHISIETDYY